MLPALGRRAVLGGLRRLAAGAAGAGLVACSPIDALNAVAPDRLAHAGIAYGRQQRQLLDVYAPQNPSHASGPFGVVMFLYGGAWDSGSREFYRFVGGTLAAHGMLTVIPDYRLYPEVRYPEFLEDCAAAAAWVRDHASGYGGRPGPFWLMGHSAGAYNAAMLALDPRWLAGVDMDHGRDLLGTIGLAGPYDFLPLDSARLRDIFSPARPLPSSQPINHVDGRAAPMLLLAGTADQTVDPGNTTRLAARIRAAGGTAQTSLYPGVDHRTIIGAFSGPLRFLAPSLKDSLAFMRAGMQAGIDAGTRAA